MPALDLAALREDWERIAAAHARILWGAGIRPGDRILICSFFSLYLGSWGALAGGERLGATVFPFGAGAQGQTLQAVHWARDLRPSAFYGTPSTQLCDPETFRPLPYGAEGAPVYTHLERTSQPVIRLVSGDRARWVDEPCPCGRTYPRLPRGLDGRFDDMIIVRGEIVYPGAIEDTLRAIDGFGGEFRVIVSRREAMDELLVRAEYSADHGARLDALRTVMRERLRGRLGVHPVVELVPEGTLPRTEFKARRVIDDRDLYRQSLKR
jgi:phenylacetate-CoA ligase